MDLFNPHTNSNLLPFDGEVITYGFLLNKNQNDYYFQKLLQTILWEQDELVMFGKLLKTNRKVAWYGNEAYPYSYSNTTKTALPWTPELLELKALVENETNQQFNSCLLNLYHNGEEGMSWHSDDESELGNQPIIASLSLGALRKFSFKHKILKNKVDLLLQPGSLIVMKGETQLHWLHTLPKSKKVTTPRINLTFRTIYT
ncbi:MAG: alpha-ketoglutarate-dependent dioxygenase AlkB [Lutibacter sp.]|nr:alpha-ketoglutarate-dependent dioxygenase AlkB [Lutibacter sp.]MBP9600131.1 alpha-ketoglutarate-dependent dioxygenase AlkB [Lutibacter sp.]